MSKAGFLVGALLAAVVVPRRALAVDQGHWQLCVGPAFGLLLRAGKPAAGLGGRLEGRYGLRDDSAAWLAVGASFHPIAAGTVRASVASGGFSLAFDVFRIVPFVEAGATVVDLRGAGTRSQHLGAELAVGGEYLLDRRWSVAAVARYHYLPVHLGGPNLQSAGLLTAGLRFGRNF